jgi:hypothetical protein
MALVRKLFGTLSPTRPEKPGPRKAPRLPAELILASAATCPTLRHLDQFAAGHPTVAAAPRFLYESHLGPSVEKGPESSRLFDLIYSRKLETEPLQGPLPHKVTGAQFLDDGRMAILYGEAGKVALVNPRAPTTALATLDFESKAKAVAISPDGKRALAGMADGWLRMRDVETNQELSSYRLIPGKAWFYSVGFSPDGEALLAHGHDLDHHGEVVVHIANGLENPTVTHCFETLGMGEVKFHPNGKVLVQRGYPAAALLLWEPATQKVEALPWDGSGQVRPQVSYTPAGDKRLVYSQQMMFLYTSGRANVTDRSSDRSDRPRMAVDGAAFTPDGHFLLTSKKGKLHTFDLREEMKRAGPVVTRDAGCGKLLSVSADGHALGVNHNFWDEQPKQFTLTRAAPRVASGVPRASVPPSHQPGFVIGEVSDSALPGPESAD